MRTFKLTDDCTLSGKRLHRDERRVEGGGYVCPERHQGIDLNIPLVPSGSSHVLLPAHGVVPVRAAGMKPGETLHCRDGDATKAEREAVAEWVWRTTERS